MSNILHRLNLAALCLLGAVLTLVLAGSIWPWMGTLLSSQAQNSSEAGVKAVEIERQTPWDPIKIVKITEEKDEVSPGTYMIPEIRGKPFRAGETWLRDLSFTLKNRTSREISFIPISLYFQVDEAKLGEDVIVSNVWLGQLPSTATPEYRPEIASKMPASLLRFRPGEEMTISLSDKADAVRAAIEKRKPFSEVTMCAIIVDAVYFADGLKWSGHGYLIPDSGHPSAWLRLSNGYLGNLDDAIPK